MIRAVRTFLMAGTLALALAGLIAGCTGKDGKDGTDGTDGAQGPTGPTGTAECMECHTDSYAMEDYVLTIRAQFEESMHQNGETYLRKDAPCSGCHTSEGFQELAAAGTATSRPNSSKIGCFACHAPHTNRDFTLRRTSAVVLDMGGGIYDQGPSNTCATCHQARVPSPAIDSPDPIRSSRWGGHHAAQANFFAASGAYQFPDAETYPTISAHVDKGCVDCHMGPIPANNMAGGHTFKVEYQPESGDPAVNSGACAGCHSGWSAGDFATNLEDARTDFAALVDSVKTLLVDKGWVDGTTGLIVASSTAPLSGLTSDDKGALYNYYLLDSDRASGGIHNVAYESAVLRATLDYLNL